VAAGAGPGRPVDVHYRGLDDVGHQIAEAREGRFRIECLMFHLAGIPTYIVAAELALNRVLRGSLPRPEYPDKLRITASQRWRADARLTLGYARDAHAARGHGGVHRHHRGHRPRTPCWPGAVNGSPTGRHCSTGRGSGLSTRLFPGWRPIRSSSPGPLTRRRGYCACRLRRTGGEEQLPVLTAGPAHRMPARSCRTSPGLSIGGDVRSRRPGKGATWMWRGCLVRVVCLGRDTRA
jgi:hypothetical protein